MSVQAKNLYVTFALCATMASAGCTQVENNNLIPTLASVAACDDDDAVSAREDEDYDVCSALSGVHAAFYGRIESVESVISPPFRTEIQVPPDGKAVTVATCGANGGWVGPALRVKFSATRTALPDGLFRGEFWIPYSRSYAWTPSPSLSDGNLQWGAVPEGLVAGSLDAGDECGVFLVRNSDGSHWELLELFQFRDGKFVPQTQGETCGDSWANFAGIDETEFYDTASRCKRRSEKLDVVAAEVEAVAEGQRLSVCVNDGAPREAGVCEIDDECESGSVCRGGRCEEVARETR